MWHFSWLTAPFSKLKILPLAAVGSTQKETKNIHTYTIEKKNVTKTESPAAAEAAAEAEK